MTNRHEGVLPDAQTQLDVRWTYRTFLIIALLGGGAALLYSLATGGVGSVGVTIFGGAVLVAGAAAFTGALVGFVFAIPRSRQSERVVQGELVDDSGGRRRLSDYSANTNLEQISDWLTKILVGISLIQFDDLAARFDSAAIALSPMLGADARPVTGALMAYYGLWGFFVAYLVTRLWLPRALSRAEREEEVRRREAEKDAVLDALQRRVYNSLYEPEPGGFTRAIEAVESYHAERGSLQSAWLWLYLAAAYGQKHSYETGRRNEGAAREAARRAVAAVEQALKLDSGTRPILEQMYRGEDPNEADLASLRGDERMERLLGEQAHAMAGAAGQ